MADFEDKRTEAGERAAEPTSDRAVFVPYADIYEEGDVLTLVADMPGVPADGVDVRVEKDALIIHGRVPDVELEGGRLVHPEYRSGDYERTFTVSHAIDTDRIEATIVDGVLTVRLPKAERAKERKVQVKPG